MKVELNKNWYVDTDAYNYILLSRGYTDDGKTYEHVEGYYSNIPDCIRSAIAHDIRTEDLDSLRIILRRIDEIANEFRDSELWKPEPIRDDD